MSRGAGAILQAVLSLVGFAAPVSAHVVRPTDRAQEPLQYNALEEVLSYRPEGGAFALHYSLAGSNSVNPADLDGAAVPDYVEQIAEIYAEALALYLGLGFLPPLSDDDLQDNGGDPRFDIYLVSIRPTPGGYLEEDCPTLACRGFIVHPNRDEDAQSALGGHRAFAAFHLFRAIEGAYHGQRSPFIEQSSAAWGTVLFEPSSPILVDAATAYLAAPQRGLGRGQWQAFMDPALFLAFLHREVSDQIMVETWERLADPAVVDWRDAIANTLLAQGRSLKKGFAQFCALNLLTGPAFDPGRGHDQADAMPQVARLQARPGRTEVMELQPMSARFFEIQTKPRATLTARLLTEGATGSDDLQLIFGPRDEERFGEILTAGAGEPLPIVEALEYQTLIVGIANTSTSSLIGPITLCAGDRREVEKCAPAPSEEIGKSGCICIRRSKGELWGLVLLFACWMLAVYRPKVLYTYGPIPDDRTPKSARTENGRIGRPMAQRSACEL